MVDSAAPPSPPPAGYWLATAALTVALVSVGASPLKTAGFVIAATAVGVWRRAVIGPGLALCLVLPQQGGAFPAILSASDLVLVPLLVYAAVSARWRGLLRSPRLWAIGGLWVAGAVAIVVGVALRDAGLKEVAFDAYPAYGHMLAFVVTAVLVVSAADRRRLVWWMVGGSAVAALIGVLQVLGGDPVNAVLREALDALGYSTYDDELIHRYLWWGARKGFAAYFSPNGLGAAAMFGLLLAAALWAGATRARLRATALAATLLLFAGLVATISRGAAVGAVVGLLVLATRLVRAGARARGAAFAGLAVAVPVLQMALLAAPSPARTAPEDAPQIGIETKQLTGTMKIQELFDTVAMLGGGAVLGAGYGALWTPEDGFVLSARTIGLSPAYGEIVYRAGIVGAVAVAGAVLAFAALWRSAPPEPLRLALLGAAATSLVDHPFLTVPGLSVVFWAAWGMLEAARAGRT